ncbi:MAG: autotransporter domain-containing protein, partial [Phascolarctobacterium sp.]|nr:autotransporter domain-containing protein [Candidatus Phascolarctobacterium caballi]
QGTYNIDRGGGETLLSGGHSWGSGNASGNIVNITNVIFNAENSILMIYGGYSEDVLNNAYSNTVNLDNVIFNNSIVEGTIIVLASNNTGNNGGLVEIKSNGLVNNTKLTLGGGKVAINGDITGTGDLIVNSYAGENNANITQNSLTIENVFTTALSNIIVTTLTNNGTLNVTDGILHNIAGTGTTTFTTNTVNVLNNVNITGTLNVGNKTINMQNGNFSTLTVNTLTGVCNVKIDADLNENTSDKLSVTDGANAVITLSDLIIVKDTAANSGTLENVFANIDNLTLTESVAVRYTSNSKYTFTNNGGSLSYTREDSSKGLSNFINGDIDNFSITEDMVITEPGPVGIIKNGRQATLPLNGYNITGNNDVGFVVNQGCSLTILGNNDNPSIISGFAKSFDNKGAVNLEGVKITGNADGISNDANLNFKGNNIIEDKVFGTGNLNVTEGITTLQVATFENTVNINQEATVKIIGGAETKGIMNNKGTVQLITADSLCGFVQNEGLVDVEQGGTITKGMQGHGTLKIHDEVTICGENVKVGTIEIAEDAVNKVINIGKNSADGYVVVSAEETKLNGGMMFLDPAWIDGVGIEGASNYATNTTTIDGSYVVGENSILSLGTVDGNDVVNYVNRKNSNITWGQSAITAGVYLAKTVDITNGAIYVDGSLTSALPTNPANGSLTLKDNSLLMVNSRNLTDNTAITGVGNAEIGNATIYLRGARTGQDIYITDGGTGSIDPNTITLAGLGGNFHAEASLDGDKLKVHIIKGSLAILEDTAIPNVGEAMEKSSNTKVMEYLDNISNLTDDKAAISAINALANMSELANVQHGMYNMSNQMTDAVADHLRELNANKAGWEIWASYIRNHEKVHDMGLEAIDADYTANYNGVIVGADLFKQKYVTAGIALTYANGDVSGNDGGVHTKNDADYFGLSIYGRIDKKIGTLFADISYMNGRSDIKQYNFGTDITAKPKTDAFTIGFIAEKDFAAGKVCNVIPYVGLRYLKIGTGDFENNLNMTYDMDSQNIVMLPIGVVCNKVIEKNGWKFNPTIELGYRVNFGNRNIDQKVSFEKANDNLNMKIVDNGYWVGKLRFSADSKRITYGIGYTYMRGSHARDCRYMLNTIWKF